MEKLTNPGVTRAVLARYGIRARKKYGQNFLTDGRIVRGIVEAAGITKEDCVLEIGPGIGTMTQVLSEAAGTVVCVEIDETLRPVLSQTLEDCDNVEILWQDILKTDLKELSDRFNDGMPLKVVANLPYYVTTPILLRLLEDKGRFESITVMVQKEVAERICAGPGSKEYGASRARSCTCRPMRSPRWMRTRNSCLRSSGHLSTSAAKPSPTVCPTASAAGTGS